MIKIPINILTSCQKAVSLTILPGLEQWITIVVVRCLIYLVKRVWKVQAVLLIRSQSPYPLGHRADGKSGRRMIKIPTLLGVELRIFWFQGQTPYPLGYRADGKSGRRMIKIPINILISCQKAESFTILPGLELWIIRFVVRGLIQLATGIGKTQAVLKIWQCFS